MLLLMMAGLPAGGVLRPAARRGLAADESVDALGKELHAWRPALVKTVAYRFPCLRDDAEDVVSNAFADLLASDAAKLRKYDGRGSIRAFVAQVVFRKACDCHRGRRESQPLVTDPPDDADSDPARLVMRDQEALLLHQAIDRLPDRLRQVVRLQLAGMDYAQIGQALGIATSGARARATGARRKLEALLPTLGWSPRRAAGPGKIHASVSRADGD